MGRERYDGMANPSKPHAIYHYCISTSFYYNTTWNNTSLRGFGSFWDHKSLRPIKWQTLIRHDPHSTGLAGTLLCHAKSMWGAFQSLIVHRKCLFAFPDVNFIHCEIPLQGVSPALPFFFFAQQPPSLSPISREIMNHPLFHLPGRKSQT